MLFTEFLVFAASKIYLLVLYALLALILGVVEITSFFSFLKKHGFFFLDGWTDGQNSKVSLKINVRLWFPSSKIVI